jgi:hypothetical protein
VAGRRGHGTTDVTERPGVGFRSDRSRRAFPLKSGNLPSGASSVDPSPP